MTGLFTATGEVVAKADQVVRVITLAHALADSRRGISLRDYARKRGFPERTVYNDFKTIEKIGFPIVEVSRGRYRLSDTWRPIGLPNVDPNEALALFLARQLFGTLRSTSLGKALERVWTKVAGVGPQGELLPDRLPWLSVRDPIAIDYTEFRAVIATLESAIRDKRVVRLRHRRSTGEETVRDVEPGELHWDPGLETLYLIGWCRLREAVRVFAVHRISDAELRKAGFDTRPETRTGVALRNAFRVWRSDRIAHVRLRLRGRSANEARERKWHVSQVLEEQTDKSVVVSFDVAEVAELEAWLLGLGADVTVLQPRSLAERLAMLHRRAAKVVSEAPARTRPSKRSQRSNARGKGRAKDSQ